MQKIQRQQKASWAFGKQHVWVTSAGILETVGELVLPYAAKLHLDLKLKVEEVQKSACRWRKGPLFRVKVRGDGAVGVER